MSRAQDVAKNILRRCAYWWATSHEKEPEMLEIATRMIDEHVAARCAQVEAQLAQAKEAAQDARDIADRNERLVLAAESEVTKLRDILITARCVIRFFAESQSTIGKDKARECQEVVDKISAALTPSREGLTK
jgi:Mg2+ and Co2+ transporter CorA